MIRRVSASPLQLEADVFSMFCLAAAGAQAASDMVEGESG